MTGAPLDHPPHAIARRSLRTPRSAAAAGIAFSLLFGIGLLVMRWAVPADPADAGDWLVDGSRRQAVLVTLGVVPFAGIAFLWFIGVVRDRIGEAEDRFFATVFLGSGLLFVALLFVSAAVALALVDSAGDDPGALVASEAWTTGRHLAYTLLTVYAMRMAAVFMIATSTILRLSETGPRWLSTTGYAIAVVLLLVAGVFAWIELLFPLWVLAVSIHILLASHRQTPSDGSGRAPADRDAAA